MCTILGASLYNYIKPIEIYKSVESIFFFRFTQSYQPHLALRLTQPLTEVSSRIQIHTLVISPEDKASDQFHYQVHCSMGKQILVPMNR
jgi:hypothetical protein